MAMTAQQEQALDFINENQHEQTAVLSRLVDVLLEIRDRLPAAWPCKKCGTVNNGFRVSCGYCAAPPPVVAPSVVVGQAAAAATVENQP